MKTYKFTSKRFCEDLLSGKVFLNLASALRRDDGYGDGRADDQELTRTSYIGGEAALPSNHPLIQRSMVPDRTVVSGETMQLIDNCLLYCMSMQYNEEICREMAEKFNADACTEIADVDEFARLISQYHTLRDCGFCVDHAPVRYSDEILSVQNSGWVNPFLKRTKYAWQCEYRIIFKGKCLPDAGQIVHVPRINSLIRRIH